MDAKSLLIGIVSFIAGGLLVSTAAATFDKPQQQGDSMTAMMSSLEGKQGDAYDQEFISQMIMHHQGAIDMARLSAEQAKHPEIKQLSKDIVAAQEKEIANMKAWRKQWGYKQTQDMQMR